MYFRILIGVVVLVGALGWTGAATAYAQERDGCYEIRSRRLGCGTDVRPFNFTDPVVARNGWHQLSNNPQFADDEVIFISHPNMEMEVIEVDEPVDDGDSMSVQGDYAGSSARELYCIVYARGC